MKAGLEGISALSVNGCGSLDVSGREAVSVGGGSGEKVDGDGGNLLMSEAKLGIALAKGVWNISIAYININSLLHKQLEVVELARKNGWDITCLVDTRMREHHVFCDVGCWKWLSSPLLASDSTEAGGIAVLVSPRIAQFATVVPALDLSGRSDVNLFLVALRGKGKQSGALICSVYLKPKMSKKNARDCLKLVSENIGKALSGDQCVVVGGDFNARCGITEDEKVDHVGKELIRFSDDNDLSFANSLEKGGGKFTRVVHQIDGVHRSTLDYLLVSTACVENVLEFETVTESSRSPDSDHRPIVAFISIPMRVRTEKKRKIKPQRVAVWAKADVLKDALAREEYQGNLKRELNEFFPNAEVDVEVVIADLERRITRAACSSGFAKWVEVNDSTKQDRVGADILRLIRERNVRRERVREMEQNVDDAVDQTVVFEISKRQKDLDKTRKELRRELRKRARSRTKVKAEQLLDLAGDPSSFWSRWRCLEKSGSTNTQSSHIIRDENGELVSDEERAPTVVKQLLQRHKGALLDARVKEEIESSLKSACDKNIGIIHNTLDATIVVDEVENAMLHMRLGTAPGVDELPLHLLRFGGFPLAEALTKLYNSILEGPEGVPRWPVRWSTGLVVLIPKPGAKTDEISGYREITLLPVVAKILERILSARLSIWVDECGLLSDSQGGFRSGRRTEDNIFTLSEIIHERKSKRLPTFTCFIDIKTAYDSVWREKLWLMLSQKGCYGRVWSLLQLMFVNVTRRVRIDRDVWSEDFDFERGVAQGSVLSPLLYDIFINGLLEELEKIVSGVDIDGFNVSALAFADDIALIASDDRILQLLLDVCSRYGCAHGYDYNNSKSKVLVFGSKMFRKSLEGRTWCLGGCSVLQSDSYKYLGVDLVCKHSWGTTVDRFISTAERKANRLRGAGCASAFMGVAVVRKLYMSLVRPSLEFAAAVWVPTLAQLKKMDSVLVQFARKSLGLPPWTSNAAVMEEIGVWPQWARQDFLVLLYFGYLCACPPNRLLRWCFLLRCKSVDRCGSRQKRARSCVQQMKATLEKYGLSICWRARSVSSAILEGLSPGPVVSWRTMALRKVVAELDRIRGEVAASSVSASVLVRRYGSVKLVPWHIRAISGVGSVRGELLKRLWNAGVLPMRSNLLRWAERRFPNAAGDVSSSSASALSVGVVASSSAPDVSLRCVSCGQPEVLNHLFFCAGLSHLKVKLLEECRAALVALARPGAGPPRNLELICDSVNARDDVSAAVALDLFLGSGRVGAVALSKKEALAVHRVFCSFVARAWAVRASWSGGSPVLGQRGGIIISKEIWPRPFGGL